jgi:hypothetical protein
MAMNFDFGELTMMVWYVIIIFNDAGYRMLIHLQVTRSHLYEWSFDHAREITSFIRYIVRAAIASTPSTSPMKDDKKRDVSLAVFQDKIKGRQFDFGIGNIRLDPDEDLEVVDLPDI